MDTPATVCVDAKPHFTIAKAASGDALPGSTITYTVTVTNDGTAPGSTSFTDDYDNRLTPTVPAGCTAGSGVLTCSTDSIDPGKTQVFTSTATLPASYTGPSGTGDPCTSGYGELHSSSSVPNVRGCSVLR